MNQNTNDFSYANNNSSHHNIVRHGLPRMARLHGNQECRRPVPRLQGMRPARPGPSGTKKQRPQGSRMLARHCGAGQQQAHIKKFINPLFACTLHANNAKGHTPHRPNDQWLGCLSWLQGCKAVAWQTSGRHEPGGFQACARPCPRHLHTGLCNRGAQRPPQHIPPKTFAWLRVPALTHM